MRHSHRDKTPSKAKDSPSSSASSLSYSPRPMSGVATAKPSRPSPAAFHPCDILLQSEETAGSHPGNHNLKRLVHLNIEMYGAARSETERRDIVESILGSIHQDGGRFLKFVWPDGEWREMPAPEAEWIVRASLQASNEKRLRATPPAPRIAAPGRRHGPRVLPRPAPHHPAQEFLRNPGAQRGPAARDHPRHPSTEDYNEYPTRVIPPPYPKARYAGRKRGHLDASLPPPPPPPSRLLRDLPSPRPTGKHRDQRHPTSSPSLRISLDGAENAGHPNNRCNSIGPATPKSRKNLSSRELSNTTDDDQHRPPSIPVRPDPTRPPPPLPGLRVSPVTHRKRARDDDDENQGRQDGAGFRPARRTRREHPVYPGTSQDALAVSPRTPFRLPPYPPHQHHHFGNNGDAGKTGHPREPQKEFYRTPTISNRTPPRESFGPVRRHPGEPNYRAERESERSASSSPHPAESTATVVTPDTTIGKPVIRASEDSRSRALPAWAPPEDAGIAQYYPNQRPPRSYPGQQHGYSSYEV